MGQERDTYTCTMSLDGDDDDDDGHQPCWNAPSRGQTVGDEENVQEEEEGEGEGGLCVRPFFCLSE